jgi:hypothetical protein
VGGILVAIAVAVVFVAWRFILRGAGRVSGRIATWRMRPRLRIEPRVGRERMSAGTVPAAGATPRPPHTFIPMTARNADFAWLVVHNDADRPQSDATDATARLRFSGSRGHLFDFRARWRNSPQVWQMLGDSASIVDRIVIRANDREELDVVIRWEEEADAYAFNTESQRLPNWCKPDWRLPPGEYRVRVRVSARNALAATAEFDLTIPAAGPFELRKR